MYTPHSNGILIRERRLLLLLLLPPSILPVLTALLALAGAGADAACVCCVLCACVLSVGTAALKVYLSAGVCGHCLYCS